MKKAILPLSVCTLLFAACSKDKGVITPESLVVGNWKLTTHKITLPQLGRLGQFDLLDTMATCKRDDLTEFTAERTLYCNQGAVKCNKADSQRTYGGNWQLVDDNASMQITNSPVYGDVKVKVNELSTTTLHLSKDTVLKVGGLNIAGTTDRIYRR